MERKRKWKKDRKVKFDFSSNFQLKGWGLCGGSGEDFYKCLWSLISSGKRKGMKLDVFRALDPRGETSR